MNPVTAREKKKGGGMSGMVEVSEVRKYEEQQRCVRQRTKDDDGQRKQRIEGHGSS